MPIPTVSVVLPAYNRAGTIRDVIDSVLGQTFRDHEVLVVDDASSDDLAASVAAIGDSRVRLLSHEQNRGVAAARNTGIAAARGAYVAFLDSDDQWLPGKLERQLEFMRRQAEPVRASCTGYVIFTPYRPQGEVRTGDALLRRDDLFRGCRVSAGSTLMAETALFREIGPLNESLRRLEDWEWLLRYVRRESLAVSPEVLSRIDCRVRTHLNYEEVGAAVAILKREHLGADQPRPQRAAFLGALENELAATAYKTGRYGLAAAHMLRSLRHYPYRNMETLRRIAAAVGADLLGRSRRAAVRSAPGLRDGERGGRLL